MDCPNSLLDSPFFVTFVKNGDDMEIILAVICALIVGAIAGYMFGKRGVVAAEQRSVALQDEVTQLQVERSALQTDKKPLS